MTETIKIIHTKSTPIAAGFSKHIDASYLFADKEATQADLYQHKMLAAMREPVIEIKDCLRKAIISGKSFPELCSVFAMVVVTAWRMRRTVGKVQKSNTLFRNTHNLIDIFQLIKECHNNNNRNEMINSAGEILISVVETDRYYGHIFYMIAKAIIKLAESGKWVTEDDGVPAVLAPCWDEDKFNKGLAKLLEDK